MHELEERLLELRELGIYRRLRLVSGPQGPRVLLDGRPVVSLCSNDYLGLAEHPRVREAAADAARHWGVGAGSSRLLTGTMTVHRRLEERLAALHTTEACILFGSGYLAQIGVIGALAGERDGVFCDELAHAATVDGCRLSGAPTFAYRHRDVDHLAWALARRREHGGRGRPLIVTDSVFPLRGDIAPLVEIVELAEDHGARVVVDESHAVGVLGPGGRGAVAEAGLERRVIVTGSLATALGSYGAYVSADTATVRYLVNVARTLVHSTAPPVPSVAGAIAALELLQSQPQRIDELRANAAALRGALNEHDLAIPDERTPIVSIAIGDGAAAMAICEAALARGVFAAAVCPPAVAPGAAHLRLAVSASHTELEMRSAAACLAAAGLTRRVAPRAPAGEPLRMRAA